MKTIGDYYNEIEFDHVLSSDDPRYVSTVKQRGEDFLVYLCAALNIKPPGAEDPTLSFKGPPSNSKKIFFCGHRGSGKSTEIRAFSKRLSDDNLYFVIIADIFDELNIADLTYTDVLILLAKKLFEKLREEEIRVDEKTYLEPIITWADSTQVIKEHLTAVTDTAETGAGAGLNCILSLFTRLTFRVKNTSSETDSIRTSVANSSSDFITHFNTFIAHAKEEIKKKTGKESILFVLDGFDKLELDDCKRVLITEVTRYIPIEANQILVGNVGLPGRNIEAANTYEVITLPMIALYKKEDLAEKNPIADSIGILKEFIHRRIPEKFFDPGVAGEIIRFSGGNPRQILHLLNYAYAFANNVFTQHSVEKAQARLSQNFERFLEKEHYRILVDQDQNPNDTDPTKDKHFLLENLALLQYNSYWWRSHPAVRTLKRYRELSASPPPKTP